jgi:catechol 2,3-dioxygenase-like lactoylglutathione lyase family enzyme
MKPRIKVLTLGVDDLDRSLAFYRDGIGLEMQGLIVRRDGSRRTKRRAGDMSTRDPRMLRVPLQFVGERCHLSRPAVTRSMLARAVGAAVRDYHFE